MSGGGGATVRPPLHRDPWVLGALAAGLALRLAYAATLEGLAPSDPLEYDAIARNVVAGEGFTNRGFAEPESWVRRPPVFVGLLAAVYALFGHDLFAARVLQCLLGTALVAVTAALADRIGTRRTARATAAAAAAYPYLVYYSGYLMAETPATLFFHLSLLALAAETQAPADGRPRSPLRHGLAAGAWLGLAALTRSFFLGFLAPLALALPALGRGARRGAVLFAAVALGAVLVVTPWIVRSWLVTGELVLIQSSASWGFYQYHLWFSEPDFPTFDFGAEAESWVRFERRHPELFRLVKELRDPERDRYFRDALVRHVAADPLRYLRDSFRKLVWFWRPSTLARTGAGSAWGAAAFWVSLLSYVLWLPAFLAGLVLLWRGGGAGRLLVWGVVYVTAFHTFLWYGSPRFRFPIYPTFLIACVVAGERALASLDRGAPARQS